MIAEIAKLMGFAVLGIAAQAVIIAYPGMGAAICGVLIVTGIAAWIMRRGEAANG